MLPCFMFVLLKTFQQKIWNQRQLFPFIEDGNDEKSWMKLDKEKKWVLKKTRTKVRIEVNGKD